MSNFCKLIEDGAKVSDIGDHLDALDEAERIEQVRACGAKLQAKLWEAAEGQAVTAQDFVEEPDKTIIYAGRNTLPAFNFFQKRFWRPADGGDIVGYNHQSMSKITGPGYFVTEDGDNGELVFNYVKTAELQPPDWPGLKPNTGLIPAAVYGNMLDYNRRVSKDTVIGCATKKGKTIGQYYLLTRARELE
jgi:hypothetical protein